MLVNHSPGKAKVVVVRYCHAPNGNVHG